MLGNNRVLGIIPARGGSVGIPNKNIRQLHGKPLIAWTIESGKKSTVIDRLIVSTDSEAIADVSRFYGCDVPFMRPAEFAASDSPGELTVIHALEQLGGFDIVVLLQPTSPLRSSDDIDSAVRLLVETESESCISVTESHPHPNWMKRMVHGKLRPFLTDAIAPTRQSLEPVYGMNGAVYVAKVKAFLEARGFHTDNIAGYVMPAHRSLDIDTEYDLILCERLIQFAESGGSF